MLYYRSFRTSVLQTALPYQIEAFNKAIVDSSSNTVTYDDGLHVFTLNRCYKFKNTFFIKRADLTLSGVLTEDPYLVVLSTNSEINSASIGSVTDSNFVIIPGLGTNVIAKFDYVIEYRDSCVQILRGENIWLDSNKKIIIGWHGSYSPPSSM